MADKKGDIEKEMKKDFEIIEDEFGVKWCNGGRVLYTTPLSGGGMIIHTDKPAPPQIAIGESYSTGWIR